MLFVEIKVIQKQINNNNKKNNSEAYKVKRWVLSSLNLSWSPEITTVSTLFFQNYFSKCTLG